MRHGVEFAGVFTLRRSELDVAREGRPLRQSVSKGEMKLTDLMIVEVRCYSI